MPIATNPSFDINNPKLAKRPLYALRIHGTGEMLTTFQVKDLSVALSGYGVAGYGLAGYGL